MSKCKHVKIRYYKVTILKEAEEAWESALNRFANENCEVRIEEIKKPEKMTVVVYCNFKECSSNKNGKCTRKSIHIVDGWTPSCNDYYDERPRMRKT